MEVPVDGFPSQNLNDGVKLTPKLVELIIKTTIETSELTDLNTSLSYNVKEGSFAVVITRNDHVFFPQIARLSTDIQVDKDHSYAAISHPSFLEMSEQNVVLNPFRITISGSSLRASFQVLSIEKDFVPEVIKWTQEGFLVSEKLLPLLNKVSAKGNCRVCEGLSPEEAFINGDVRVNSSTLVKRTSPFLRYESPNCSFIKPNQNKSSTKCQECQKYVSNLKGYVKRKGTIDIESNNLKRPKYDVSSRVKISTLTPRTRKKRFQNLRREKKWLLKRNKQLQQKLEKLKVPLNENQSKELSKIVEIIERDFPNQLTEAIEGSNNGNVSKKLREAWKGDRDRVHQEQMGDFFKDQIRNETGKTSNIWSMITYRIALAIYIRSPAAYRALRSFKILQLPCEDSLKDFTRAKLQKPGINFDYLAEQKSKYEEIQAEQVEKGLRKPLGEGILIFDEVHCITKVHWNAKNNELTGLALDPKEYESLIDVYKMVEDDMPAPTDYILQFLWRDLSYKFDIVGPYVTSSGSIKHPILYAILLDVLDAFHSYGFKTRALVCDGASSNLSLIKHTLKQRGSFSFATREDGSRDHSITASFKHPCWPFRRLSWIICPSHELKSMVSALYASRPLGTKGFQFCGVEFGWNAVRHVYDEDLKRSNENKAKRVRKLYKSYIDRDTWTRLNVAPSKIMQQEEMLVALYEIAYPDDKPAPPHQDEIIATREYLLSCNKIFEEGILKRVRMDNLKHEVLSSISEGFSFFENWLNDVLDTFPDINLNSPQQRVFLSWQTWDLLRVMVFGFKELAQDFLTEHPNNCIIPGRVNGSAIESLFGQFREVSGGKLTGSNYISAQRTNIMKIEVQGQKFTHDNYRGCHISVAKSKLKRVRRRKLKFSP